MAVPIVYRVQANRADLIKAALDVGVDGLMVPLVETPADAAAIVEAAKYPPMGRRGFGPWRASNYYLDLPAYADAANERIAIIPQIESALGGRERGRRSPPCPASTRCSSARRISAARSACPSVPIEPKFIAALEKVSRPARRAGRATGIDAVSQEKFELFAKMGFTLFTYGSDFGYLDDGAKAAAKTAKG